MSQEIPAIYEGGVFRPVTPLNLPESTPVTVVVAAEQLSVQLPEQQLRQQNGATIVTPLDLQQQQRALDGMFAAVDKLPQTPCHDGLSNRDHDQILYGSPK